jgi:hypothetical protein
MAQGSHRRRTPSICVTMPKGIQQGRHMDESVGIDIDRSPEDVWAFVSDLPKTPRWRPHLGTVRWLDEGKRGVGAKFETVTTFLFWRNVRIICEITEWEPPHHFRYVVVSGPIRADALWGIRPRDKGCRFFAAGDIVGSSRLAKISRPLARPLFLRQTNADLRRLKEVLERGASPTP